MKIQVHPVGARLGPAALSKWDGRERRTVSQCIDFELVAAFVMARRLFRTERMTRLRTQHERGTRREEGL